MDAQWAEQVVEEGSEAVFEQIDVATSVPRWLTIYASLCFALRYSDLPVASREVLESLATNLEVIFEAKGLTPPPTGWRSSPPDGPLADWAGVDGSRPKAWVPSCQGCTSPTRVEPVGLARSDKGEDLQVWICRRCRIAQVMVVDETILALNAKASI